MLLFIMFQVCYSYILDIVVIDNEFMHMFVKRLAQDARGLSGRHYVSMVFICCLRVDTPYILGHMVDHGCDTPIESFVVHSLTIGQVGSSYKGRQALFLIFLSNIPHV